MKILNGEAILGDCLQEMKINQKVKVVGGNYEIGVISMIGSEGVIRSFGTKYKVKGKDTKEVYVDFDGETHVFNNYHLTLI